MKTRIPKIDTNRLFQDFGDFEIFGRSKTMELLNLKPSEASKLLVNLFDKGVIEKSMVTAMENINCANYYMERDELSCSSLFVCDMMRIVGINP